MTLIVTLKNWSIKLKLSIFGNSLRNHPSMLSQSHAINFSQTQYSNFDTIKSQIIKDFRYCDSKWAIKKCTKNFISIIVIGRWVAIVKVYWVLSKSIKEDILLEFAIVKLRLMFSQFLTWSITRKYILNELSAARILWIYLSMFDENVEKFVEFLIIKIKKWEENFASTCLLNLLPIFFIFLDLTSIKLFITSTVDLQPPCRVI